ncbi:uncharacterized protein LOC141598760 [Silene latifolia]|uniref:uncharacterized protein LOC141598760 n=1 Tax=Silene latifolia TaxID=37657 RepID=UPI003D772DE5
MHHGKSLAKQLDKAKTIPKPTENNIYDEVEKVITGLINDLNKLDDDEYTTKECFDKVVRKTMSSLEELKKHDDPQHASGYEALVNKVGKYLNVLILKGCHNLESLPQFKTIIHIRYLDMSDCYQLDHPANVLDGCAMLRVVKGFVLPRQQDHPPNSSFISNPSQFKCLWMLTLRTRRFNFPTNSDLETLCELQSLTHLKITWVGACSPHNNQQVQFDAASYKFPPKLAKFEMEAASESTSTNILDLIAQQKKTTTTTTPIIPLKKLYIKGGNISKLNPEVNCKILRLHYLPKMEFDCYDMRKSFPKLHRLEMSKDVMYSMLRRSFQKATGTNDQNSGWEPSLTAPTSPPSAS